MEVGDEGKRITSFYVHCDDCGQHLPMERTAVEWTTPAEGVQVLDLLAYCADCHLATPAYIRVMPDGRLQSIVGHQWREYDFLSRKEHPAWWDLSGWLRTGWQALKNKERA